MFAYIIFDVKNLNMDWAKGEVPDITYGLSDSGWIDMVLFENGSFVIFYIMLCRTNRCYYS